jgi:hypothetical protein
VILRLRCSILIVALAGLFAPIEAAAQSSLFGVRGLGFPGRPLSARTRGTGGSFALFDGESDANPAAITSLPALTVGLVAAPGWRRWDTPAGEVKLQDTRFPLMFAAGLIPGSRLAVAVSVGSYADRDYTLATRDTVSYRGVPIAVRDTVTSLGGLNQLRLAFGYRPSDRTRLGAAVYWITGSQRMKAKRIFEDSAYQPIRQAAELTYSGVGVAAGVTHRVSPSLELAGTVRMDSKASVDRDSTAAYDVDLPWSAAAGMLWRASRRLTVGAQGAFHTWGSADADVKAAGGIGARNTLEFSAGVEVATNPRRPTRLPIRFGARYAELPFLLHADERPRELGLSLGTGARFSQDRIGLDAALEYSSQKELEGFSERTFRLVLGLAISPYVPGVR